jgi:hypothetical protein
MHLEELKKVYRTGYIAVSINLTWMKLEEYYQLIDDTPVYTVALFLYLKFRFNYFKN